jgi:C4-dicarboxylate transporter DctM subunit
MEWGVITLLLFGSLLVLLMLGVPVAFSLLIVGMTGTAVISGIATLFDIPNYFFHYLNSFTLTCLPLFIVMSMYIRDAHFSDDIFRSLNNWLSWIPGRLMVVSIAACAVFAAIVGASSACAAAVGLIALPEFKKHGYDRMLSVGSVAAGGSLGILIPPSIPMILYCIITETSIGHVFAGGILPGIMTAIMFSLYIIIRCLINPKLAPPVPAKVTTRTEKLQDIAAIIPIALIIFSVLGSIYLGIATPTESAAIGSVLAAIVGFAYKRMNGRILLSSTVDAIRISGFLILILMSAIIFGHVIVRAGIDVALTKYVVSLGLSSWGVFAAIMIVLFFLGLFMDPTPIVVTTMPIFFPLAMQFGFDPIWFGVVVVMNLEMAGITPPVGFNLFVLQGIGKGYVSLNEIVRGAAPFIPLYALTIVLVVIFPQIIMFLPGTMK